MNSNVLYLKNTMSVILSFYLSMIYIYMYICVCVFIYTHACPIFFFLTCCSFTYIYFCPANSFYSILMDIMSSFISSKIYLF